MSNYYSFYKGNEINVIPDSYYMTCGDNRHCDVCSNVVWNPQLNTYIHDTLRGKVFCPFGMGDTLNQHIYNDQETVKTPITKWGMAPQMDPRSLTKIGLSWKTS